VQAEDQNEGKQIFKVNTEKKEGSFAIAAEAVNLPKHVPVKAEEEEEKE